VTPPAFVKNWKFAFVLESTSMYAPFVRAPNDADTLPRRT
jgi:hypothetical protein